MTISLGTYYTNQQKFNNFISLSIRIPLSKSVSTNRSKMQERMMDPVVRDIDIVTQQDISEEKVIPVYYEGRKIHNVYFVMGEADDSYEGDGTRYKPFSMNQLMKLTKEKKLIISDADLIVPILIGQQPFTQAHYVTLVEEHSAVDILNSSGQLDTHKKKSFDMKECFSLMEDTNTIVEDNETFLASSNEVEQQNNEWEPISDARLLEVVNQKTKIRSEFKPSSSDWHIYITDSKQMTGELDKVTVTEVNNNTKADNTVRHPDTNNLLVLQSPSKAQIRHSSTGSPLVLQSPSKARKLKINYTQGKDGFLASHLMHSPLKDVQKAVSQQSKRLNYLAAPSWLRRLEQSPLKDVQKAVSQQSKLLNYDEETFLTPKLIQSSPIKRLIF